MEEGEAAAPPAGMEDKPTLDGGASKTNGHSPNRDNVALPNGNVEEQASAPQSQQKSPENKTQDARAEAFEKQYRALQQKLRQRDEAMMDLADENEHLNKALTELKENSKEAVLDKEHLAEKLKRQQISLKSVDSALRKAQAEAVEARKEANDARRETADARREATEFSVALADARADVVAIQQAAKGKALGEDERRELEGALKALSASVQRAAQEAASWKENAQNWKVQVESLKQELDGRGSALAVMENELTMARQQVKDSDIRVLEANRLQSVAEGALQELRQESDRRARTFNSAVKAAVGKIQFDLENERDVALERVQTLQKDVETQSESLRGENEALSAAQKELSAVTSAVAQLEEEGQAAKDRICKLQKEVGSWQAAAEAAEEKVGAAHEVAGDLTNKVAKLESRCEELRMESEAASRNAAALEASMSSDISQMKSALTSAQNEHQFLQLTASEKLSKATAEQIALRSTIADLEGQLKASRAQVSSEKEARPDYWLDNLGLERINWKSKLRSQGLDSRLGKRAGKDGNQPSTSYDTSSWPWPQRSSQEASMLRGRLSQRSIVLIVYIAVLHIIVMVSFTQRSEVCPRGHEAEKLPGW